MSVGYRSQSSLALATRTNSTFTAPAGIVDGDVLLCVMMTGGPSAVVPTPPAGFSLATGFPVSVTKADPWTMRIYAFSKIASGESGNYTFTHSSGSTEGVLLAISGASASAPLTPDASTVSSTTSGGTETITGVTTTVNDSLVVLALAVWDSIGASTGPPSGTTPTFTERYDPGTGGVFYVATGPMTTAGATGSKVMNTDNLTGNPFLGTLIVVAPSSGGGGGTAVPVFLHHLRTQGMA